MSIEILAKVDRENAIFMAGEAFTVSVLLRNVDDARTTSLAWGCVQLHCDQLLLKTHPHHAKAHHHRKAENDAALIDVAKSTQSDARHATAVPRAKQAIYSSPPAIIFCDMALAPGERLRYDHCVALPLHMPPTFKGHFVKYHWYVSVAVQHVDAPIKMFQLPVRVVNVTVDITDYSDRLREKQSAQEVRKNKSSSTNPAEACRKPDEAEDEANPFNRSDSPSLIEVVSTRVEEVTAVRKLRIFEMKSADSVFAVISVFRQCFKLGDDIVGRISFLHDAGISCLQILVRVETVEVNLYGTKREEHITHHFTEHLVTAFVRETHFKVPLPLSASPSFSSEAVQLRWRVHFEFVTSVQRPFKSSTPDVGLTQLAADLNIETVGWDMYVAVHSCNPHNAAMILQIPSTSSALVV